MKQKPGYLFESRVGFPTTDWSLICDAQASPTGDRGELLGTIIRHYWKPLYAFYRTQGQAPADAEDSVQGLFVSIVEGEKISQVQEPKGRFRDWLIACARNYLRDRVRRDNAQKRRPASGLISFEEMKRTDGLPFEPPAESTPDMAFLDAWRRELLKRALDMVMAECLQRGRQDDYRLFAEYYLCADHRKPTWKQLAERHGIAAWKQASHRAEWVKIRLNRAVRQLVREYVGSDDEIDDELRTLLQ